MEWLVARRARDLALLSRDAILDVPMLAYCMALKDRSGAGGLASGGAAASGGRANIVMEVAACDNLVDARVLDSFVMQRAGFANGGAGPGHHHPHPPGQVPPPSPGAHPHHGHGSGHGQGHHGISHSSFVSGGASPAPHHTVPDAANAVVELRLAELGTPKMIETTNYLRAIRDGQVRTHSSLQSYTAQAAACVQQPALTISAYAQCTPPLNPGLAPHLAPACRLLAARCPPSLPFFLPRQMTVGLGRYLLHVPSLVQLMPNASALRPKLSLHEELVGGGLALCARVRLPPVHLAFNCTCSNNPDLLVLSLAPAPIATRHTPHTPPKLPKPNRTQPPLTLCNRTHQPALHRCVSAWTWRT